MKSLFLQMLPLLLAGLFTAPAHGLHQAIPLTKLSLKELKQQQAEVDAELEQLARLTFRRGVGSLGYRSNVHKTSGKMEWVQIELEKECTVDTVVLVPMLFRESHSTLRAEGFPRAFRVLAGTGQNTNTVATVSADQNSSPRTAPLSLSFPPTTASWIRIETSELTSRPSGNQYLLQLSEIMVFSGMENVALNKPVITPEDAPKPATSLGMQFAVDGFTPYTMDAAYGKESKALLLHILETNLTPRLTIDLNAPYTINQINFHSAALSYAVPMGNFSSWAVPRHVQVTGAMEPDFSDETLLCEYRQETIYDNGPIIMRRFPATLCRHIAINILDHIPVVTIPPAPPQIAFSEIEVLSAGRNTALHAPVSVSNTITYPDEALLRITDGCNYYGEILPLKVWMTQLSRRHDLESFRPLILAELNKRHERQKTNLLLTRGAAVALALICLLVWLLHRHMQKQLKDRIAADLHDEIGANLHGIGLLTNLAEEAKEHPENLQNYLNRILDVVKRSGIAVRNITDLKNSNDLFAELKADMERAAERIVARQHHQIVIEGEDLLPLIPQKTRIDLFLFYKECLINISRHSGATRLATRLKITPHRVYLSIADNGRGLPDSSKNKTPPSLKRRARFLHAHVRVLTPDEGGTKIELNFRLRPLIFHLKRKNHEHTH
ncbi:histidine kinase [Pontiellaceae bacterium B12219]|nr:histidine kinase [Pontiellaceae bacterium B12219]